MLLEIAFVKWDKKKIKLIKSLILHSQLHDTYIYRTITIINYVCNTYHKKTPSILLFLTNAKFSPNMANRTSKHSCKKSVAGVRRSNRPIMGKHRMRVYVLTLLSFLGQSKMSNNVNRLIYVIKLLSLPWEWEWDWDWSAGHPICPIYIYIH